VKVGVIGLGTVGRAISQQLARVADVVGFDPTVNQFYPEEALAECDFAVICVNTPPTDDGTCDTSKVAEAVGRVPVDRILIKSTVAPGTTDRLIADSGKQICVSPEYLGETGFSMWRTSADVVPFIIVGGEPPARTWMMDRLMAVFGPDPTYHGCSAIEAEIIKYMENSFLATKVTFANEFYEICRAFGADWHRVREGWLLDPRVGRSHSAVFAENRGFDGKCLPKDLAAIVSAAIAVGCKPQLLEEVLASNSRFRAKNPPPCSDDHIDQPEPQRP
jgi:UDPglucose 6-dehydrogenase